jgi:hypothetical protein
MQAGAGSEVSFNEYSCWETVWIKGQVGMHFQIGSRHFQHINLSFNPDSSLLA